MIGVRAADNDAVVVAEFFELFKTPWEFCRPGRSYEVVLQAASSAGPERGTRLTVCYGGRRQAEDGGPAQGWTADLSGRIVRYPGGSLPLYGECITWGDGMPGEVVLDGCAAGPAPVRVGYHLFDEVRWLLTRGQPVEQAAIPTLELHIDLLRGLMTRNGADFDEARPAPAGYRFIAALTHDVDHPSLRLHGFDHTVAGFLGRATAGSVSRWASRRLRFGQVLSNWGAALRWPAVVAGIARDFWRDFVRYPEWERGRPSTFFVIPFSGRPGRRGEAEAPAFRASGYGAADIRKELQTLSDAGCEIGLHGLDAWWDTESAARERSEVERATGIAAKGVRMHWLYFSEDSTAVLDQAGFDYDSTVGYNETIGFRAGTAQAYRPLGSRHLLELPLVVMDTALFYPSHLNLKPAEAWQRVEAVVEQVARFGGCMTVNWHDRSLGPERQWGDFYRELVGLLEAKGAWVTSGGEAVQWFRRRRSSEQQ